MHGIKEGSPYLKELCYNHDMIFVQEHWLAPFNVSLLDDICPDFLCYATSCNNVGKRAFSVCGPIVWKSLPTALRYIYSYPVFRRALKSFI